MHQIFDHNILDRDVFIINLTSQRILIAWSTYTLITNTLMSRCSMKRSSTSSGLVAVVNSLVTITPGNRFITTLWACVTIKWEKLKWLLVSYHLHSCVIDKVMNNHAMKLRSIALIFLKVHTYYISSQGTCNCVSMLEFDCLNTNPLT